jgi:hypothetical protein
MNAKRGVIASLLRLYPADWRNEYGSELEQILADEPLTARVVADVLCAGLRERVRAAEPGTSLALALAMLLCVGLAWNLAALPPYGNPLTALIAPSAKTLPTVVVAPFLSDLYVIALVACGWWSWRRDGRSAARCGLVAAKGVALGSLPVTATGILMALGVIGVQVMAPGSTPTSFAAHGPTLSYYYAGSAPTWLAVTIAPLFAVPGAWLWGTIGGALARKLTRAH